MLRLILTLPFLIVLVAFVVVNTTREAVGLPFGISWQTSPGIVALVCAVVFFLLGALLVWFAELRQRRRARKAEAQIRTLDTQIAELRAQLAQSVAQNVAYHGAATMPAIAPGSVSGLPPAAL